MKRQLIPALLSALLGGAIVAAAVLGLRNSSSTKTTTASSGSQASTGTRADVASTTSTASQVYSADSAGIVAIKAVTAEGEDSGTGIFLNGSGLILTNDHVIAGASSITVAPGKNTSQTRTATLVGEEANSDIALIRVDPAGLGLKPLKLVSSSSVQVGDTVYAIGNPYNLDETLTTGIVSALRREIQAPNGAKITGVIQTDAALNPGNSGGPLLNSEGDVIGINSQIASDQSTTYGSQPGNTGVGFAISSNTAEEAIKRIEAGETTSSSSQTAQSRLEEERASPYGESQGGYYEGEEGYGAASEARGGVVVVP